jgi:hypothetical protein
MVEPAATDVTVEPSSLVANGWRKPIATAPAPMT